ncbi:MAG: acyltransferase family protein [Mycobacteriales bacterium]
MAAAAQPGRAAPTRLRYRPELDGLRGVGVMLVMVYHVRGAFLHSQDPWPLGGYLAVDTFFPLSGMLITGLLVLEWERHGRISLRAFYRRRIRRLLPALVTALAAHALFIAAIGLSLRHELAGLGLIIGDLANVAQSHGFLYGGLEQTWSLSIEEQFYLLWPPVLLLLLWLQVPRPAVRRAVLLAIAVISLHVAWHQQRGAWWWHLYHGSDMRFAEVLLGCWVGLLPRDTRWVGSRARTAAAVALCGLALTVVPESGWMYDGGTLLAAVLIAVMIAPVRDGAGPPALHRLLAWRPFVRTGEASYSLYLWHGVAFVVVAHYTPGWPLLLRVLLGFAATAVTASACYIFVEQRFREKTKPGPPARTPTERTARELARV